MIASFKFFILLQAFLDYANSTDPNLLETMMKEITEQITKLWDALMGLEMQLVDQLEVRRRMKRRQGKGRKT